MSEFINLSAVKEKIMASGGFDADSSALYCPNPQVWYSRAYLEDNYEDLRVIPNVKDKQKIARVVFGGEDSVLYEFDCDFTDGDSKLDAVTIETCPYSVMHSICQRDVEETFAVQNMTAGNENWKNETNFFSHYWDALAMKVQEDIAITKWQGHTSNDFVCVGLEQRITASGSGTIEVTGATGNPFTEFTISNIEEVFEQLLISAPATIARRKKDLRFYVSPVVANLIAISMAKNNTTNYVTVELGKTYAGIKISEQSGMSDDLIVLTKKDNLIVGVDALADPKNLKIRDLDVINVPRIRTRVDGKIGTLIVNPEEILYVSLP
jgi:hypothetical protein